MLQIVDVPPQQLLERILTLEIVRVTERAAVAAARLRGHGNNIAADQAAVDAMRRELNKIPIDGTIVIGEGERDKAPSIRLTAQPSAPRVCRERSQPWRWRRAARC
jgi:fructose-1,6-bisphosphatase II / sedoheptulose-1,7-bisphosphatase